MSKKKNDLYRDKQIEIFDKLMEILNYNGDHSFILYEMDNNEELQNSIMDLTLNIRRYYNACSCPGLNNTKCKRPYMSIIRFLCKSNNMNIISRDHIIKNDVKNIRTKIYYIRDIEL